MLEAGAEGAEEEAAFASCPSKFPLFSKRRHFGVFRSKDKRSIERAAARGEALGDHSGYCRHIFRQGCGCLIACQNVYLQEYEISYSGRATCAAFTISQCRDPRSNHAAAASRAASASGPPSIAIASAFANSG